MIHGGDETAIIVTDFKIKFPGQNVTAFVLLNDFCLNAVQFAGN